MENKIRGRGEETLNSDDVTLALNTVFIHIRDAEMFAYIIALSLNEMEMLVF